MQPATSAVANRRGSRRQKPKGSTRVICQKGVLALGVNLAVSALDISQTGIRLMVKAALAPGQEVQVALEGICQRRPFQLAATIIWCVPAADGNFCIGARFDKALPYRDLQTLAY